MNSQLLTAEPRQHAVFRALLQAMSRPGSIQLLPQTPAGEHLPDVLDCLFDQEVSFCLAAADESLTETCRQRWKARPVNVEQTDFLIAPHGRSLGLLQDLPRGSADYPDRGATVIFQVDSFAGGGIVPVLTGPGIKDRTEPSIHGLDPAELPALRKVNSEFPLGVDAIFVSRAGELLCIPRSTCIGD